MTEATQPGSPTALREMCKKELAVWAHGQRLALARHRAARDALEVYAKEQLGDRPGILIPADEAAGYAMALRAVLDLGANAPLCRGHVEALYRLLSRGGEA